MRFPRVVDRTDKLLVQTGNLENVISSQRTICNLMQKINLKGVDRPRKRRGNGNPFDLFLSKRMFKKTNEATNGSRALSIINRKLPLEGSREEAQRIVKVAEQLGLQLSQKKEGCC